MPTLSQLVPYLIYTIAFGIVTALYILSIGWAYYDARSRRRSGLLAAVVVAILAWPVGLVVWMLLRPHNGRRVQRFGLPRQFGVASILLAVAVAAIVVTYVAGRQYAVIALVRVPPTEVQGKVDMRSYSQDKTAATRSLQSMKLLATAVRNVTGEDNPRLVTAIGKQLKIEWPGGGELVSVKYRGSYLRDNRSVALKVVDELVRLHLADAPTTTTVVQNATLIHGTPSTLN